MNLVEICNSINFNAVNKSDARRMRSGESGVKKQNRETVDSIDGFRRFEYDYCGTSFTRRDNLKTHQESKHEGVRYECDKCDCKATRTDNLERHQESMHGGVMYECNKCDYKATRMDNLERHQKSLHEGVRYECNKCDYKVTQIQSKL